MKKNNTIKLTENEFKKLIKESVNIILEKMNYSNTIDRIERFDVDLYGIDSSEYPELDEFLQNESIPDTISVEMSFDEQSYDPGDYLTPPMEARCYLTDYTIDYDNKFKKIIPHNLYDSFIKCVEELIDRNSEIYEEQALELANY